MIINNKQEYLREKVRIAKALNPEFKYKEFSEMIGITINGFYNWLGSSYNLSDKKAKELEYVIDDLIG